MNKQEQIFGVIAAGAALTAMTTNTASADPSDFEGAYVGLGFGTIGGQVGDDYLYAVGDQLVGSAFAGYNWSNGNMVYGGEVAIWSNDTYVADSEYGIENLIDLRGRVGMALSDTTMLYGSVGVWQADYLFYGEDDGGTAAGLSIGAGFETIMSNGMFIGADVTMRSTSSADLNDPGDDDKSPSNLTTASLRFGFRF
jgi:hypothetical protein